LDLLDNLDEVTLGRGVTVHYAAMALKKAGQPVTVETVINYIARKHKLNELAFTPELIQKSLEGLQNLGFLKLD